MFFTKGKQCTRGSKYHKEGKYYCKDHMNMEMGGDWGPGRFGLLIDVEANVVIVLVILLLAIIILIIDFTILGK